MKNLILWILGITLSSLMILNFSSGIIAGIWLLIIGEWQFLLFGIVLGFIMPWVYSIAFLPQLLLLPLFIKFGEKGHKFLFSFFGFILALYNHFLLGLWVSFVFSIMIQANFNPILMWLWGYATVMAPIGYMASKEDKDSTGTVLGAFFCQVSYVVLTFCYFILGNETLGYGLVWLLLIAFSSLAIFLGVAQMMFDKKKGDKASENIISGEVVEAPIISDESHPHEEHKKRFCSNCGKEAHHDAKYCKSCGNEI
jgi:hypothetical protein